MSPPRLELLGVSRTHRSRRGVTRALDGVDLALEAGTVTALVGASGAGKSTLARIAAGLERPDAGEVRVDGAALLDRPPSRRAELVQLVHQEPALALNPARTLGWSLLEPLAIRRAASPEAARRLAERVHLDPGVLERRPSQASGGQKRRVVLARAIALSPRVLILDEPLAGLDAAVAVGVLDLVGGLAKTEGLTVLLVTHDLRAARRIAGQLAVLQAGRLVERGGVEAILSAPGHPHTRALVDATPPWPVARVDHPG